MHQIPFPLQRKSIAEDNAQARQGLQCGTWAAVTTGAALTNTSTQQHEECHQQTGRSHALDWHSAAVLSGQQCTVLPQLAITTIHLSIYQCNHTDDFVQNSITAHKLHFSNSANHTAVSPVGHVDTGPMTQVDQLHIWQ